MAISPIEAMRKILAGQGLTKEQLRRALLLPPSPSPEPTPEPVKEEPKPEPKSFLYDVSIREGVSATTTGGKVTITGYPRKTKGIEPIPEARSFLGIPLPPTTPKPEPKKEEPEPVTPIEFLITHADPSESQVLKTSIEPIIFGKKRAGIGIIAPTTVSFKRRKAAESEFQQVALQAQQSLTRSEREQFRERFVKNGEITDTEGALQFLLEFAALSASSRLQSSREQLEASPLELSEEALGRIETRQTKVIEEAYKSLTPEEKKEFGFKYTEWETIPVEKRIEYLGAEKYFESVTPEQKEKIISEFIEAGKYKEVEKHEIIPAIAPALLGPAWLAASTIEQLLSPSITKKEKAWQQITLTEPERRELHYAGLPITTRIPTSTIYAFGGAVMWPVTVSQLGVKFVTGEGDISKGKPLILPDVAKEWGGLYPGGPAGGIQTWISEGRSQLLEGEGYSYEMEQAKKYPLEMGFATFGEVFGLYVGGKGLGLGVRGAKLGVSKYVIKPVVRYAPKVVGKIKTITGVSRPIFESEAKLLEGGFKVVGKPQTPLTRILDFPAKVSQTEVGGQLWRTTYGWSTGKLVRVKTLPMVSRTFLEGSRTGVEEGPYTIFGRVTKYRGWGKPEWVPGRVAEQVKVGEQVFHVHKVVKTTPGVGERIQIYSTELVSKPKGHLWLKRVKTQTASIREIEKLGTRLKVTGGTISEYGSWVRPGYEISKGVTYIGVRQTPKGMVNIWAESEASASLVRPVSVVRPMLKGGIHGTGYLGEYVSLPTSAFTISPMFGILAGTISRYVSEMESGVKQVLVPKSELGEISLPLLNLGEISTPLLESEKATKLSLEFAQASALVSETELASVSELEQAQVQIQAQRQILALQLENITMQKLKTQRPGLIYTPFPPIFKPKIRFIPPFPPLLGGKREREIMEPIGQGFNVMVRERRFFKGKEMKEGKFIQINKVPLSELNALSLGGTVADNTPVRTFKIVKTSGKPKQPTIETTPWPFIQLKFIRKKDRFIEQDFAAIDTMGEHQQITVRGWMAERRKQQKAPVSMKKPRVSREIRPSKDIFDTDFLQPSTDFNKNLREFENLFRRFNHGF